MKKLPLLLVFVFILSFNASSQSCLPEGIIFITQEQINTFQNNYPGCTEIEGDVEINGDDITDLNGLSVLIAFGSNLTLSSNNLLTNVTGLGNVTTIGGGLLIELNDSLTSLSSLNNLTGIGNDLEIFGNPMLTDLSGLNSITEIPGNFNLGSNVSLTSLNGLNNLAYVGKEFNLRWNSSLTNLVGLDNLSNVGERFSIGYCNSLTSFIGLENLTHIDGYLLLYDITSPISFSGLNNLLSIDGGLYLNFVDNIEDFSGLENLTTIGGLYIGYNGPNSFNGLNNLQTIEGHLSVEYSIIEDFTGLESLISIRGTEGIRLENNGSLSSLSGLDNIDAGSLNKLRITDNPSLSFCAVQGICDYLLNPTGTASIGANAPGCNSRAEVEFACETISIKNLNSESTISIFPNPAQKEIAVSIKDCAIINEVKILNQTGQQVLHEKDFTNPINISILQPGMYVIEVQAGDLKVREKLVVR